MAPVRGLYRQSVVTPQENEILMYGGNGTERAMSIVVDDSLFTADALGYKSCPKGALLVKMTSGPNAGAYGPYASGASDGRQTPGIAPNCIITTDVVDLTLGPEAIGGYYAGCDFNLSKLTLFSLSAASNNAAIKAAFPLCLFF